jgi:hypothetical protein
MEDKVKKIIICLILILNSMMLFSQDFFTIDRYGNARSLSFDLRMYDLSIHEFSNIFASNALRILLGDLEALNWSLDIFSLAQLDNQHLRLLRNLIYARHGLKFNSSELNSYFNRFEWYNPKYNNVDHILTDRDKWNIEKIQAFENRNENIPNVVWNNPFGFWHDSPVVAAGYGQRFIIHPNNRLEFYFSDMTNLPISTRLNGNYTIRGNVLIYSVTEIHFLINNSVIRSEPWGLNWESTEGNKIILENPMIYKFSISGVEHYVWDSQYNRNNNSYDTIIIGGQRFFRFSEDVNYR